MEPSYRERDTAARAAWHKWTEGHPDIRNNTPLYAAFHAGFHLGTTNTTALAADSNVEGDHR